jgi:hypothetical protein
LSGGASHKARVQKVVNTDTYPGLNLQKVSIVVDKPWWNISDIVQPEDNNYRLRVVGNDNGRSYRKLGTNQFQYDLVFTTNNANLYLPRVYMEEGAEWCKVSSAVADEDNQDYGGFQFYNIFQSEGVVQQHAVKVAVSDKVARRAKAFADAGEYDKAGADLGRMANSIRHMWTSVGRNKTTGLPIMRFMSLLDAEAFNELYRNVENTLMFGQESTVLTSPEGHQIYTASGLREQLESGWVLEHNGNLSLQELEDWFDNVIKDRISEGEQKIVLSAGRESKFKFNIVTDIDTCIKIVVA